MRRFAYGLKFLVISQVLLIATIVPLILLVYLAGFDLEIAYDLGYAASLVAFSFCFIACLMLLKYSR